jgi:NADH:ubiquinone reductase (non-electrogenic)
MVFTPLLASTCVGTLETRAVCQAIADLQPALRQPQNFYYAGSAVAVNPNKRVVEALSEDGLKFFVEYDLLAIATGSQGSTFGIPGVEEHTHFLRDAAHGTAIRNQLMRNWNLANIPGRSIAERDRILHCVIVGGGPTGVEFAGELADFVNRDLARIDNDRARDMRVRESCAVRAKSHQELTFVLSWSVITAFNVCT